MARRKENGLLDEIASLPWPAGVVIGIAAFILTRKLGGGLLTPFSWLFLLACWAAAGVSFLRRHQRVQLLETQTGLESLSRMNWREFEMLVGEAFRRRGYVVEETGLGGKDGGIDLIVSKSGRTELVQCKQWRTRQVKAATVREMWGLVDHHRADGVNIVCIGDFTRDAKQFADGKAIELINGQRLLELVREVQVSQTYEPVRQTQDPISSIPKPQPICPRCAKEMVQRINRQTNQPFWGCSQFPRCNGTRTA